MNPLGRNVIIKEIEIQKTTDSGIILQSAQGIGDSRTAVVVGVGPLVDEVKVDDIVMLMWNKVKIIKRDENKLAICAVNADDIVAVVEG